MTQENKLPQYFTEAGEIYHRDQITGQVEVIASAGNQNQEPTDDDLFFASLIVRALVTHDEMLAALKECRLAMNHHGIVGDPAQFVADAAIAKGEAA